MPASTADPIASSLKRTFSGVQNGSNGSVGLMRGGNSSSINGSMSTSLESRLQASSKKGLLMTNVQFDTPTRYVAGLIPSQDSKSRYIILNPQKQKANKSDEADSNHDPQTIPKPKMVFCNLSAIEVGYKKMRPAGAGMLNVGNTCYLNSTLQALFHTPAFFNFLMEGNHTSKCTGSTGVNGFIQNCTICALSHTLRETLRLNVIRPNRVYEKLKSICKHMVHGRQEDAHEFLRYLIESLQRSFLISSHAPKNIDNASKETTPFNQIFGGYMRQEVTCLRCKHVSTTFQHFMDILLDIRQVSNIEEALSQYFRQEKIGGSGDDGANMYKCEKCKVKVPAKKRYLIERPPAVLCIQLKRFSLFGGKISKPVQLSRRLDVAQYVKTASSSPVQYSLVAMITHVGPSPNCGHYTAIGEAANGQFYQFDDSSVRPISVGQVLNTASYVVFYEMTRNSWRTIAQTGSSPAPTPAPTPTPSTVTSASNRTNEKTSAPTVPPPPPPVTTNKITFHRSNENKPKLISLGSSNKIGIVAKNVMGSIVRSVTNVASTANGHLKKGLVPYDDDGDSSDENTNAAAPSKQPQQPVATPPFVPRAVAFKTMNRPQQITGNQTPVVEKRQSSSGMFTVTDMDHHNPSVNSDNSTGSTSNGWVVKDARPSSRCSETNSVESSSSCPPQFKSTLQRSSSIVSKASSNGSESKKSLSPSSSNGLTTSSSETRKTTTEIDVGAFAKTLLNETPRKRANGGPVSTADDDLDDYDADFDRGRTKKVRKYENGSERQSYSSRSGYNPFQNAQNRDRRSESGSLNRRYPESPNGRNRSLSHRDHNYHVDWQRNGGKKFSDNGGGRRKSFSDFKHYGKHKSNNGRHSHGGSGRGDNYRSNDHRDYYGNRYYKR